MKKLLAGMGLILLTLSLSTTALPKDVLDLSGTWTSGKDTNPFSTNLEIKEVLGEYVGTLALTCHGECTAGCSENTRTISWAIKGAYKEIKKRKTFGLFLSSDHGYSEFACNRRSESYPE